jgi:hypothetical protein
MTEGTTYDVRFWKTTTYKGKRKTTYRVRWTVAGQSRSEVFVTRKLAESFKAKLMTAAREGVPFDRSTGLPTTMATKREGVSWYEHAVSFMGVKWDEASPRHRQSTAEGLITLTTALVRDGRTYGEPEALRGALRHWAFNVSARRRSDGPPEQYREPLRWIEANSLPLTAVGKPQGVREALRALGVALDGRPVSASTMARKRAALSGALVYAVELGSLPSNPLAQMRAKRQPRAESIDVRVVVNPEQARALLAAVKEEAPPLHAYFACLYFAGLRPAEARNLREADCRLPPDIGGSWCWPRRTRSPVALGPTTERAGRNANSSTATTRRRDAFQPIPSWSPPFASMSVTSERAPEDGCLSLGRVAEATRSQHRSATPSA